MKKRAINDRRHVRLEDMPYTELLQMEAALIRAKASARATAISEARDHVLGYLQERGLKPSDVFQKLGTGGDPKNPKRAPAKYHDPDNRANTWGGRGRKPKWVQEHLDNGGNLSDLAV